MTIRFQSDATKQGDLFAQSCVMALRKAGFEIKDENLRYRVKGIGVELDAIANGAAGQAYAFEFKGSWNIDRPGAERTDTLKKAIANGALFLHSEEAQIMPPIILLTSHMPKDGAGQEMMQIALETGYLLDVLLPTDGKTLSWYSNAVAEDIERLLEERKEQYT